MKLLLKDIVSLKPVELVNEMRDSAEGLVRSGRGLKAVINASHAGIVTRNNTLYLPSEMRKAVEYLNKGYQKPFLVHHDKHKDPIGRIISATYVDTSHAASQFVRDFNLIRSFQDASEPKRHLPAVEVLRKSGVLSDPNWEGLGYLQVEVHIPDPDAAQKFLDGRYQTVSVGLTAGTAICSLPDCYRNWADEAGPCDHVPGKTYEGERMCLIVGDFRYDEISAVNTPADPFASVIQIMNSDDDSFITEVENPLYEPMTSRSSSFICHLDFVASEATTKLSLEPETPKEVLQTPEPVAPVIEDNLPRFDYVYDPRDISNEEEYNFQLDWLERDEVKKANPSSLLIRAKHNILKRGTIYNWLRRTKSNMNELEQKIAELEGKLAASDVALAEKEVQIKDLEDKVYVLRDELRISLVDNKALEERELELSTSRDLAKAQLELLVNALTNKDFKDEEDKLLSLKDKLDVADVRTRLFPQAGLTQNEIETTVTVEDAAAATEAAPVVSQELQDIANRYQLLKLTEGTTSANRFVNTLLNVGLLKTTDIDILSHLVK